MDKSAGSDTKDPKPQEEKLPAGTPPAPENPQAAQSSSQTQPEAPSATNTTASTSPADTQEAQALLNSLLTQSGSGSTVPPVVPPAPPVPQPQVVPETVTIPPSGDGKKEVKKRGGKAFALVTMMILLVTIPIGVYYYFQQRQAVYEENFAADSCVLRATCENQQCGLAGTNCDDYNYPFVYNNTYYCCLTREGPYPTQIATGDCGGFVREGTCLKRINNNGDGQVYINVCPDMTPETWGAGCQSPDPEVRFISVGQSVCLDSNYCGVKQIDVFVNFVNTNPNCFVSGYEACNATPPPPGSTPTPTKVVTPTPTPAQCISLRCYDDSGAYVSNLGTLRPGDKVTFGVIAGPATKARFRVNGSAFIESTRVRGTGAAKEFVFPPEDSADYPDGFYTIPNITQTTTFKVESEIYVDGAWK